MSGHPRSGWWKLASRPEGWVEDDLFRKLMWQALQREDKANHMVDLVLGGGAPPWLTERLVKWMFSHKNEPFPEWAFRLAVTLLSQEDRSPLWDHFMDRMFDPDSFFTPSWLHTWGSNLASRPDDIPAWLERRLEIYINTHGYVPHWLYTWADWKLRIGKMDGMRKELEELAIYRWRHGKETQSWYSPHMKRLLENHRVARSRAVIQPTPGEAPHGDAAGGGGS